MEYDKYVNLAILLTYIVIIFYTLVKEVKKENSLDKIIGGFFKYFVRLVISVSVYLLLLPLPF